MDIFHKLLQINHKYHQIEAGFIPEDYTSYPRNEINKVGTIILQELQIIDEVPHMEEIKKSKNLKSRVEKYRKLNLTPSCALDL